MSCQTVQTFIHAYLDQTLAGQERDNITQHLAQCRECAVRAERQRHTRAMLQHLPAAIPPPELATRLRVLASHERERRLSRLDLATRLENLDARLRLWMDNLMRPLALPFASGLVSALFLFGMLVPTLAFQFDRRGDVPFYDRIMGRTEPQLLEAFPIASINDDATVVELTIDQSGKVTDWSVLAGNLDRRAENNLLAKLIWFSTYSPGSLLDQPAPGKITVSFQRSSVTVTPEPDESRPTKLAPLVPAQLVPYVITVRG